MSRPSLADRAKAIKTMAVINESPTEKLIRELREENQRLMEMLKGGYQSMPAQVGGADTTGSRPPVIDYVTGEFI